MILPSAKLTTTKTMKAAMKNRFDIVLMTITFSKLNLNSSWIEIW